MRECQECGFIVDGDVRSCPKCDSRLRAQTDGSVRTLDVAHRGETVAEAVAKTRSAIDRHRSGLTQSLRIIVGQGLIRDAVVSTLASLRARRLIVSYSFEKRNPGSLMVRLKARNR